MLGVAFEQVDGLTPALDPLLGGGPPPVGFGIFDELVVGEGDGRPGDVLHGEQEAVVLEPDERYLLGIEVHGVGDELAGRGGGVVVAVGQRTAALQGVGLLGQQPGLVERLRGRFDVAQAAVEQDVVDALAHEGIELDHHRADGFPVALEDVDGAGPLLAGGLEPLALGALADDALLGLDGGDHLRLDAAVELRAIGFRRRWSPSGRGSGVRRNTFKAGLGLALLQEFAGGLEPLLDVVGQLLPREALGRLGLLDGRPGIGEGRRLIERGGRRFLVIGGPSRGDPDDRAGGALALFEPPRRGLVGRVELEGLLEECLRRRGRALRESLTAQFGELRRQRRLGRAPPGLSARPGRGRTGHRRSGPPRPQGRNTVEALQ